MTSVRESSLVKRLARPVLRVVGLPVAAIGARLLRLSAQRAGVALVYHSIALRTGDPAVELVPPHGADLFEAEMRHVAHSYRIVRAADLPNAVARRRRGERFPVAVTFDDDLSSHVSLALPILRRTGVHATFFLTGATLRGPHSFWWQRLQRVADRDEGQLAQLFAALNVEPPAVRERRPLHYLGRLVEQLEPEARETFAASLPDSEADSLDTGLPAKGVRALVESGMSIGFHTRRHHLLPSLENGALAAALEEGRDELEELVGERLSVVAYPYGRADARVAAAGRRAGFAAGFTGRPEPVRPNDDTLLLGRLDPSYRSTGHLALQIVAALLHARR